MSNSKTETRRSAGDWSSSPCIDDRFASANPGPHLTDHVIHRVMEHVTVHHPVARIVGNELDVPRLSHSDNNVVARNPCRIRDSTAFGARDPKRVSVQVHRLLIQCAEVDEANPNTLSQLANQRRCVWAAVSIKCYEVPVYLRCISRETLILLNLG